MDSIFSVKNEHLALLDPQQAVEFFRELLWAEARRLGIGISKINVSTWIDVPDGGIDASIDDHDASFISGFIKSGHNGYQIKASDTFKPWQDSEIKKELFGKRTPTIENLGSSVKTCLENEGNYILVCFKQDLTPQQQRQARSNLQKYFELCGFSNPKVEVWSQNNIIGFLQMFPSLALKITGRDQVQFQTHKSWSQQDDMRKEFISGEKQKQLILNLQNELRRNDEAVHIRIYGEAGIGKTRLILEAISDEDLMPLTVYCDSAKNFRDSVLMNEILKENNKFSAIFVIDECNSDDRSYIWNKLKYVGPRIKIISIFNEYDDATGNTKYFDTPPLSNEEISSIIQTYDIPLVQANKWSELCSGSPRVAHVIGWNLRNNPEDILKSPDTVNVWERFIVGLDNPIDSLVNQRRVTLRYLALFKRFGYKASLVKEAEAIWKKISNADSQITWARFQEIIGTLSKRKILQGEYTLYITPRALHIKLWIDWWDTYGYTFNLEEFIKNTPETLAEWFYEMFEYATESEVSSEIVKDLLGEHGPLADSEYLQTHLGSRFFLALSAADPYSATKLLNRTIGTWEKEKLLNFTTGRREIIWALENLAVYKDLFADVARLLLKLGEAENETYSNNASGVFQDLFIPAPGRVAPTQASPEERFPILKEAFESGKKDIRLIALKACDRALKSDHFSRVIGQRQGIRKEPERWTPITYGEIYDSYRRVWNYLMEKIDHMPQDEQQLAINILLNHSRGLAHYPNLTEMVLETLKILSGKEYIQKKQLLEKIIEILHYDGKYLEQDKLEYLKKLKSDITGYDFPSLLRRYVGMDFIEDHVDEQGKVTDRTIPTYENLAQQIIDNPKLLSHELIWLTTVEAQNGYVFGYELGKKDKELLLLQEILAEQRIAKRNHSVSFLGGYLKALHERNIDECEDLLDELANDDKLNNWMPELTSASGMTDRAALRILDLAEKSIIAVSQFQTFGFGGVVHNISEKVFRKWLRFLMSHSTRIAITIALDLFFLYYAYKKSELKLPKKITLQLLTHESLFQKSEGHNYDQMEDWHWHQIANKYIQVYPTNNLRIAETLLEHYGEEGTIVKSYNYDIHSLLNEITRQNPKDVWRIITKYLGPPMDSHAFDITQWLRGRDRFGEETEGALSLIPEQEIWKWVDEDVEQRARYIARFVPKILFREEGKICLAREVLVRYGDRENVRNSLMSNFSTEGWTGPGSIHFQEKKNQLLRYREKEDNENVKLWIDEYVSILDNQIKQETIEEEREGF